MLKSQPIFMISIVSGTILKTLCAGRIGRELHEHTIVT